MRILITFAVLCVYLHVVCSASREQQSLLCICVGNKILFCWEVFSGLPQLSIQFYSSFHTAGLFAIQVDSHVAALYYSVSTSAVCSCIMGASLSEYSACYS